MRMSRIGAALSVAAVTVLAAGATQAGPAAAARPVVEAVSQIGGLTTVTDDTGTISIDLPADWVIDTAPTYYGGFYEVVPVGMYPTISARPQGGADWPSTSIVAQAFPVSRHEDVVESFYGDYGVDCDPGAFRPVAAFHNGVLAGEQHDTVGCYGATRHTVVADHGANYTVIVDATSVTPSDETILSAALPTIRPVSNAPISGPVSGPVSGGNDWTPLPDRIGEFRDVPQWGSEPVRGTGCGANGQIGDTIPDGTWAAIVPEFEGGVVQIDLVCVFLPAAAAGILAEGTATIINRDPDYLVVNNNTRLRQAPAAPTMQLYDYTTDNSGACVAGPFIAGIDHSIYQAWVEISGGQVVTIAWDCVPLGDSAPTPTPSAPSSNLPPAQPGDGIQSFWPYGEFWNVPQLGTEPVRGSGCGGSGQIGDRIPDGLWAGRVGIDPANPGQVWVNLLCIYYGESAQAVRAAGTANIVHDEPDYLIVDNNPQGRVLANRITAIAASQADPSGRCAPAGMMLSSGPGDYLAGAAGWLPVDPSGLQAWIRVDSGAVTWLVYGCDSGFLAGG